MTELKTLTSDSFKQRQDKPHHFLPHNNEVLIPKGSTHLIIENFKTEEGNIVDCTGVDIRVEGYDFGPGIQEKETSYSLRKLSYEIPHWGDSTGEMEIRFPEETSQMKNLEGKWSFNYRFEDRSMEDSTRTYPEENKCGFSEKTSNEKTAPKETTPEKNISMKERIAKASSWKEVGKFVALTVLLSGGTFYIMKKSPAAGIVMLGGIMLGSAVQDDYIREVKTSHRRNVRF